MPKQRATDTRPKSFRLSVGTLKQMKELQDQLGITATTAVAIAINRMYRDEIGYPVGDGAYVPLDNDYTADGHELADLRRMRDEAHPHTAELLTNVISAIEAAIERREGE